MRFTLNYDNTCLVDELLWQLEQEKTKNDDLSMQLAGVMCKYQKQEHKFKKILKINHRLGQDLRIKDLYLQNLEHVNAKFIRAIKNLQSNKAYVAYLLDKRARTNDRVLKLISTIKNLQHLMRNKNSKLLVLQRSYDVLTQKVAHIIKIRIEQGYSI